MAIPELEQQLLQLSPNDKLYIIQLLAQSLTTYNNNIQPDQPSKLSEFFRQSPLAELTEELDLSRDRSLKSDSLIAAIALQNSLSLVTRNEKDFAGTGVVIVNPWCNF